MTKPAGSKEPKTDNQPTGRGAAWRLMRPRQWPILTAQFVVSMLLAVPVIDSGWSAWVAGLDGLQVAVAWLAWVVLLNGGTLAYNSAYDRDTTAVAYLATPPQPPSWLAGFSLGLMLTGALLGAVVVGPVFGAVVAACGLLSVLYSHPAVRLKSRPGWDLLVNMVGYGGATTFAGIWTLTQSSPTASSWWFTIGFSLLFGSFYPLTQIYQTADDLRRGDQTLTTALGVRRSLALALGLGVGATAALWAGCEIADRGQWSGLLLAIAGLWCGHLIWWWVQANNWSDKKHEHGMYRALALWAMLDVALAVAWLHG